MRVLREAETKTGGRIEEDKKTKRWIEKDYDDERKKERGCNKGWRIKVERLEGKKGEEDMNNEEKKMEKDRKNRYKNKGEDGR
jgi:hypothetical protein